MMFLSGFWPFLSVAMDCELSKSSLMSSLITSSSESSGAGTTCPSLTGVAYKEMPCMLLDRSSEASCMASRVPKATIYWYLSSLKKWWNFCFGVVMTVACVYMEFVFPGELMFSLFSRSSAVVLGFSVS